MAESIGFYEIRYAVESKHQKKTWWMRVGSATLLRSGQIRCRIEATPLNWDGTFDLFPNDAAKDATAEEDNDA